MKVILPYVAFSIAEGVPVNLPMSHQGEYSSPKSNPKEEGLHLTMAKDRQKEPETH